MTQKLNPPSALGLGAVQEQFDIYQRAAFGMRDANFFALELCGECGELANLEKKRWRDPSKAIDLNRFCEEAADVLISLMNYCNARGVNLESAVAAKLKEIEQRRLAGTMGPIPQNVY